MYVTDLHAYDCVEGVSGFGAEGGRVPDVCQFLEGSRRRAAATTLHSRRLAARPPAETQWFIWIYPQTTAPLHYITAVVVLPSAV